MTSGGTFQMETVTVPSMHSSEWRVSRRREGSDPLQLPPRSLPGKESGACGVPILWLTFHAERKEAVATAPVSQVVLEMLLKMPDGPPGRDKQGPVGLVTQGGRKEGEAEM